MNKRPVLGYGGKYAFIDYNKAADVAEDARKVSVDFQDYADAFAAIGGVFKSKGDDKHLSASACDGLAFICQMLCNSMYEKTMSLDADALDFLKAIQFDHVTDARNAESAAGGVVGRATHPESAGSSTGGARPCDGE